MLNKHFNYGRQQRLMLPYSAREIQSWTRNKRKRTKKRKKKKKRPCSINNGSMPDYTTFFTELFIVRLWFPTFLSHYFQETRFPRA